MAFPEFTNAKPGHRSASGLRFVLLWQAVGWAMVALVIWLSLTPHPPRPPALLSWDKADHLLAYAALMFWFAQSFARHWRWPFFLCVLGFALEMLQGLSAVRTFDLYDMVANVLGVMLGSMLAMTPLGSLLAVVDRRLASRSA